MVDLEQKLKTAMDESRLLILGVQVLFGFQFEAVFQELFSTLSPLSQAVHCIALLLLLLSTCWLITPSMLHQLAFGGETRPEAIAFATGWTGVSLLPFSIGLGASAFVVFQTMFGQTAGVALGAGFAALALILLYGLGLVLKRPRRTESMDPPATATSLQTKVEQMLTEARVIIPGGQALLGFQFISTLTKPFHDLPSGIQILHAFALGTVALSVLLLMTPAALHRIAYGGEADETFFKVGSSLVIAASLPLAIGVAVDVGVVLFIVTESTTACIASAIAAFLLLGGTWLVYPAIWRLKRHRTA